MPNQSLPFFPELYEGDCLYDILTRFHAGSGHITSYGTFRELFGACLDLRPTITIPYRVGLASVWFDNNPWVTPQILRDNHTAWQYLQLCSVFSERAILPISSANQKRGRRIQTRIRQTLQGGISSLRYCPICLMQDSLHGKPFWHQLHQLQGVKYCPIHHVQIQNSDISITKRLMRYVPASTYLELIPVVQRPRLKDTLPSVKDDVNGKSYIILANTIDWLLKNGLTLGRGIELAQRYNAAIGKTSTLPISGTDLSELIVNFWGMDFLTELFHNSEIVLERVKKFALDTLTPLEHALVIGAIGVEKLSNLN